MIRPHDHQRGTSLAELLCVVVIMGVVLLAGVPRLGTAFEAARADEAGGALRGLWNAQRMHWLEARTYTSDIDVLIASGFIDAPVKTATEPFAYSITAADAESFDAQAVRTGSDLWTGTLSIDETGDITGQIEDGNGGIVSPYQG